MSVCTTRSGDLVERAGRAPSCTCPTFLFMGQSCVLSQVAHTPLPEILPLNLALRRAWEGMSLPCRSRGFQDAQS